VLFASSSSATIATARWPSFPQHHPGPAEKRNDKARQSPFIIILESEDLLVMVTNHITFLWHKIFDLIQLAEFMEILRAGFKIDRVVK